MNRPYYEMVGHKMLESVRERWPEEIPLRIYSEEPLDIGDQGSDRFQVYDLFQRQPDVAAFIERHRSRPDQANPGELVKGAIRFSYKSFSVIDASETGQARYLIWLDADTFTHTDISSDFLRSLLRDGDHTAYLGRAGGYSECGFVIYDRHHPIHRAFITSWKRLYTTDKLFDLPQWHDSYIFDVLRQHYAATNGVTDTNLSPEGKGFDHVFINSVLGEYIDHMKGDRKISGKSYSDDIYKERSADYWKNME